MALRPLGDASAGLLYICGTGILTTHYTKNHYRLGKESERKTRKRFFLKSLKKSQKLQKTTQ